MTNPLFDPNVTPEPETADLIGEGKRYKDATVASLALTEKDRFIEQLKAENAQMRATLKGEEKIDEFLTQLRKSAPAQSATEGQEPPLNQSETNQKPAGLSLSEVEEVLNKRERERQETANLNHAVQKVREAFGADYQRVLASKAADLGLTAEEMLEEAKRRPAAFLKLVEADKPQAQSGSPVRSQVNTSAMGRGESNEKNWAFYQKLRKEVGDARFYAPKIQNELHKDAMRLGEAFYN